MKTVSDSRRAAPGSSRGRRAQSAPTTVMRGVGGTAEEPVAKRGAEPHPELEPTTEDLLARYRRRPDSIVRNQLIERHRPEVEAMARSLAMRLPRSVELDDLTHAGLWGLVQAIDKFRADVGAPFRPFMRPRVRGAMLDELRSMDFLPRLYRQRARELDAAAARLQDRLGRAPSDAELANELGITESRLRLTYTRVRELPAREISDRAGDQVDPFEALADEDLESPLEALNRHDLLTKIEASLQPIEWTVLRMQYLEGLSGKEVADRLQLSAGRICQIHLRVLSRLKVRLASLQA